MKKFILFAVFISCSECAIAGKAGAAVSWRCPGRNGEDETGGRPERQEGSRLHYTSILPGYPVTDIAIPATR